MPRTRSTEDIALDEDRPFQERWWRAERIAWVGFGAIGLVALLGFTGAGGPFADTTVTAAGGQIEFPRATRWQADDGLRVTFAPAATPTRTLTLSHEFVQLFQIVDIEPPPERSTATAEGIDLSFAVATQQQGEVGLKLRSQHPGVVSYYAAIDGERLGATTFVLP